jgi:iron complex outermembrane receptor protein
VPAGILLFNTSNNMKYKILSFFICTLICSSSFAQSLKGRVTDGATGTALQGATINYEGNTTASDNAGSFTVPCKGAGTLTISYVGYKTFTQRINSCNKELAVSLFTGSNDLNEVQITATSNKNKSLLYQPASIAKLSAKEMKRGTGLFLDDAINTNVPGVTMNRRAVSSGQQVNIRGYGNGSRGPRGVSSNFDGQGYKVYLNGIPVTDAEGITTMDDIDYGSLGNVEIVKGPAGTLYGLAIAGAVNFNTITPEKGKTSIGQDVLFGNYGLQRYTTHFQTAGEHSSLLINYGHQKSDGFTIHNKSHKDFVNVAGDFQVNTKQTINFYGGYSNSYDERSGELTINQWQSGDLTGNLDYIKRNGHSKVYTTRLGIGHNYVFNSWLSNMTTIFGTGFNSNTSSAGGWTDKAATNLGLRSTFSTKFNLKNNLALSGLTGVETQRQNATTIGYGMGKDPRDTATNWYWGNPYYWIINGMTSNVYTTTATTSVFTEWTLSLPKDLSVTAGIGLSNMKLALDDRFYVVNKPTHFDTSYKGMLSPHVAVNKVFNKQYSAYASYSKGYKAPVTSYFYIPWSATNSATGVIDRNLKPEIGNQFEIGTKGALAKNKLIYQLAFFDAIFSHKMTAVAVPNPNNSATLYTYVVNGGKQDDKGIEASVKYTALESDKGFFSSVSPFVNFTYSDYKYKNFVFQSTVKSVVVPTKDSAVTKDYSGHTVPGVSKCVFNIGVDVNTKSGLYANVTWSYKDNQEVSSLGTNTGETIGTKTTYTSNYIPYTVTAALYRISSYSLLNAKLGYKHSFGRIDLDAYFAAMNITNSKYPIMVFVNQFPDSYIAGPKTANVFGGINLKYNIK